MNIDLRKEMDGILKEFGHYILLQRTSRKIRCRCWKEITQEADSRCTRCMGKGYISRIERHQTRYDSAIQIVSRPSLNQLMESGRNWVDARVFYFRHDTHPQVGDYIYEVGWAENDSQRPTHLISTYAINDVYAYRGDNGRIEYYIASVKSETTEKAARNVVIRSLGPVKNYELVY
ncbi:hypothetical protein D3C85_511990 [compost metagenome]